MKPLVLSSIIRPKSILVATNLNDLDFLLPVAIDQARATGAFLWFLHVLPPDAYVPAEASALRLLQNRAFRDAESKLARITFELKTMNLACAYEVRRWYPVDRINEFVREHQIMRLLIGTASRGKLGKLLVGSVAEELIRSLDIPICTVGPGFASVPQSTARRVIFATSLRHNSDGSFLFAVNLALLMEGELTLLHVMEQDYLDEGVDLRVIPEIDEMLQRARQMGCTASTRIRYGEPAEEIVAECSASKSELLVLGAVAASNLATNFRMGVAYRVIAKAPCPTFTLLNGVWTKGHTGTGRKVSALL